MRIANSLKLPIPGSAPSQVTFSPLSPISLCRHFHPSTRSFQPQNMFKPLRFNILTFSSLSSPSLSLSFSLLPMKAKQTSWRGFSLHQHFYFNLFERPRAKATRWKADNGKSWNVRWMKAKRLIHFFNIYKFCVHSAGNEQKRFAPGFQSSKGLSFCKPLTKHDQRSVLARRLRPNEQCRRWKTRVAIDKNIELRWIQTIKVEREIFSRQNEENSLAKELAVNKKGAEMKIWKLWLNLIANWNYCRALNWVLFVSSPTLFW